MIKNADNWALIILRQLCFFFLYAFVLQWQRTQWLKITKKFSLQKCPNKIASVLAWKFNVNLARFARNVVKRDFLNDFQPLWCKKSLYSNSRSETFVFFCQSISFYESNFNTAEQQLESTTHQIVTGEINIGNAIEKERGKAFLTWNEIRLRGLNGRKMDKKKFTFREKK